MALIDPVGVSSQPNEESKRSGLAEFWEDLSASEYTANEITAMDFFIYLIWKKNFHLNESTVMTVAGVPDQTVVLIGLLIAVQFPVYPLI